MNFKIFYIIQYIVGNMPQFNPRLKAGDFLRKSVKKYDTAWIAQKLNSFK